MTEDEEFLHRMQITVESKHERELDSVREYAQEHRYVEVKGWHQESGPAHLFDDAKELNELRRMMKFIERMFGTDDPLKATERIANLYMKVHGEPEGEEGGA